MADFIHDRNQAEGADKSLGYLQAAFDHPLQRQEVCAHTQALSISTRTESHALTQSLASLRTFMPSIRLGVVIEDYGFKLLSVSRESRD